MEKILGGISALDVAGVADGLPGGPCPPPNRIQPTKRIFFLGRAGPVVALHSCRCRLLPALDSMPCLSLLVRFRPLIGSDPPGACPVPLYCIFAIYLPVWGIYGINNAIFYCVSCIVWLSDCTSCASSASSACRLYLNAVAGDTSIIFAVCDIVLGGIDR